MKHMLAAITLLTLLLSITFCGKETTVTQQPQPPADTAAAINQLHQRGVEAMKQGRLTEAKSNFDEIVATYPGSDAAKDAKVLLADLDTKLVAAAEARRKNNYSDALATDESGPEENTFVDRISNRDVVARCGEPLEHSTQQMTIFYTYPMSPVARAKWHDTEIQLAFHATHNFRLAQAFSASVGSYGDHSLGMALPCLAKPKYGTKQITHAE